MKPARLCKLEWPEDIERLHPNAQKWALKVLYYVREHPRIGLPLHDGAGRWRQQGLKGCRRLKQRHGSRRLRIVYRVLPDERRPLFIEVLAIADRQYVYELAAKRLREKSGSTA